MGSTRAVETQRTATALDTGVVTPPQQQPQHHLVITMLGAAVLLLCSLAVSAQYQCNPASAGLRGAKDGIMLTKIMTFAIMTKRNNSDTANFLCSGVLSIAANM